MVFLPRVMRVLCSSWYVQVNLFMIFVLLVLRIDRLKIERTSKMVKKMREESALNYNIVRKWWISFSTSSCCRVWFPTIVRPKRNLWKLNLKSFFIFQNWIAPSFSRCILWECRRRSIIFFETSYAERVISGSISKNQVLFFAVLLLPMTGLQKFSLSVVAFVLQADLQEFLCRCCLNWSHIYFIHEKFWPKIEFCLHSKTRFWFQRCVYQEGNWS